jgi:uncharacterized protein (TIGR02284 family)
MSKVCGKSFAHFPGTPAAVDCFPSPAAAVYSTSAVGAGQTQLQTTAYRTEGPMATHEETISTLKSLIGTCIDGEHEFRWSSDHLQAQDIRRVCLSRAEDCHRAAAELRALVTEMGGFAEGRGTATGALHRGWLVVVSALSSQKDKTILEQTEIGESAALHRYRKALAHKLTPAARTLVEEQLSGVERHRDQLRSLRKRARAVHA